jgi:hypothetical protein
MPAKSTVPSPNLGRKGVESRSGSRIGVLIYTLAARARHIINIHLRYASDGPARAASQSGQTGEIMWILCGDHLVTT